MLLLLENTDSVNIKKLMDYARQLNLRLSLVDDTDSPALPGKPLSAENLKAMIENGRKTGTISMDAAHQMLRKNFNAD